LVQDGTLSSAHAVGLWPYDSGRIFMNQSSGPFYSLDAGVTFASKLGNWNSIAGTAWASASPRQLVPVWVD